MNRSHLIAMGGLVLGLLLALFVGWRVLILPLRADYAAALAQKDDIEQQLKTARATAAQFPKFKAQAEQMSKHLQFYKARVGQSLEPVTLITQMQSLANECGLDQFDVTVDQNNGRPGAGGGGGLAKVHLDLHFHGDFNRVGRFLDACVQQQRLLVPTHISLANYKDDTGLYQDTVNVGMDIMAYGGGK